MAELADAADSKSADRKVVGVRPPLPAPKNHTNIQHKINDLMGSAGSDRGSLVEFGIPLCSSGTISGTVRVQLHSWTTRWQLLIKTPSGTWKAIIRKAGWPLTVKTFRTQRDADDWARRTEDDMVRGAFIQRASGDRLTVAAAMKRYLDDIVPTKRPTTQIADRKRSKIIVKHLGKYSLTSLTPEVIAQFP